MAYSRPAADCSNDGATLAVRQVVGAVSPQKILLVIPIGLPTRACEAVMAYTKAWFQRGRPETLRRKS